MALHLICLRSAEERFWNTFACEADNKSGVRTEKEQKKMAVRMEPECRTFAAVYSARNGATFQSVNGGGLPNRDAGECVI